MGEGSRGAVAESVTHELPTIARGASPKLHIEAYNDHRIAITRTLVGVSYMLSGTSNFIWLILLAHPAPEVALRDPPRLGLLSLTARAEPAKLQTNFFPPPHLSKP